LNGLEIMKRWSQSINSYEKEEKAEIKQE